MHKVDWVNNFYIDSFSLLDKNFIEDNIEKKFGKEIIENSNYNY